MEAIGADPTARLPTPQAYAQKGVYVPANIVPTWDSEPPGLGLALPRRGRVHA